jgi:heme A synthase
VAHISGAVLVTTLALLASVAVCRKSAHRDILRLVYLKISLLLLQLALGFSAYLVRVGAAHQVQPTTTGIFFVLAVAWILALKLAIQKQTWQTSGSVLELQTV